MDITEIFRKSLQESYGIKTSEWKAQFVFDLEKSNTEKGIIYGVFSKAGVVDSDNEIIPNEVLEDTAHNYLMDKAVSHIRGGYGGYTHKRPIDAMVVESYIDKSTPNWEWRGAIKIFDPKIKKEIRDGNITGFSIGGYKIVE